MAADMTEGDRSRGQESRREKDVMATSGEGGESLSSGCGARQQKL